MTLPRTQPAPTAKSGLDKLSTQSDNIKSSQSQSDVRGLLPILLDEGYTASVSVNAQVTVGQIIARKQAGSEDKTIQLAKILNIKPGDSIKYLKKKIGDKVLEGEIIAQKKRIGLLGTKNIQSPFSGTIVKLEEDSGNLFIRKDSVSGVTETIKSPVEGTVNFCDNSKIVIQTEKEATVARVALGEEVGGSVYLLTDEKVDASKLNREVFGKIILGKIFQKAALFKSFALGAKGVIGIDIEDTQIEDLEGKNIKKTAIFLVEEDDYQKLAVNKNRQVVLVPETKTIIIL